MRTVQPLTAAQCTGFITRWFAGLAEAGEVTKAEAAAKTALLQSAVQKPHLAELARNPMLL
ncbi:MAG: hypothetical protein R3291_00740, partial [Thermoplasmata archaeon]|nr:hypothetical protein [Thermoplasmata archaeon]